MSFNAYTLEYTNNASLTAIKHDRIDWEATAIQSEDHGKHGNIKGFSRRSRQNLLRKMAQMDRTKLQFDPLFVTLTDKGDFETDARQFKHYLDSCPQPRRDHQKWWARQFPDRGRSGMT